METYARQVKEIRLMKGDWWGIILKTGGLPLLARIWAG